MIQLRKANDYFKKQIAKSNGVIKGIFLGTGENQIITAVGIPFEEASIFSTFFNDSIFIIRLNLLNGQQPSKNQKPFQISMALTGEKHAFLFSIKNSLLLGIIVQQKLKSVGHKMANDLLKYVAQEMENVVQWTETSDVY